jgi:hypothetical protein
MAKWVNASVLDNGLNQIKNNATRMLLIKAYTSGDVYGTVTAVSNIVATVNTTSATFTLSGASNRVLTTTASLTATASASSGATPDLHIAFTDGTANVLWVTDETSDQVITSGNTITFPSITYTSNQPL